MLAFWWRPLVFAALLALFALLIGAIFGRVGGWIAVCLGLAGLLLVHLYQHSRLFAWLLKPGRTLPSSEGLWGETFYRLDKLMRSHLDTEHRVSAELDQMQEATRLLPDGVIILDTQNRIQWFNEAAQAMLALRPERDFGQFITYLLRSSRFNEWLLGEENEVSAEAHVGAADVKPASAGGRSHYTQPLTLPAPAAKEKTLSLRMVPLSHEQKMLLAHDITEIDRVEAMRRDFVANVSHELRTPITVIVGFLETFAEMEKPDPAQFKQHVALLREQSERIRRLVDDLLTLARLESDNDVRDAPVDVPALCRRLLEEACSLSHGRHDITLEADCRVWLLGSEHELYSALTNLVSNAVRYTPEGGRIAIRWREREEGGAEFSVTDSGEGIEPQHIPRLTERFYRVDRGRSRATGGTGLGLAIVKHTLQRHQARLRIDSTVGKGSTFTACFPPERVIPPLQAGVETAPQSNAA
ncbi:PAS/PAC sensor signal transduction histidine kinase [Sulfuritortus calidifontis]|uniref:Phosphate regulon sensor protein PhoR n=1 Tax=Sulfuritortus calidifontis TaxID=1914471 RepID=A0A4R3JXP4_9PROT|nr:phosphate regulon sensor histidine kinase PhoR [Sulfuritortus calidifontis]TCS72189.1 PAS/PAC sensor signal transduction histidine kinase [Sulfuritortus calidifontis]